MAFHITMVMEDSIFMADAQPHDPEKAMLFDCISIDRHSGKTHQFQATLPQVTAIFALGFGSVAEDSTPGYHISVLYEAAQGALVKCERECSPIP